MIVLTPTQSGLAYGTSVQTLRQEAAKCIGAYLAHGTATAGSSTTLTDQSNTTSSILWSSLSAGVERFRGAWCLMVSGTPANIGQWRQISDDSPGSGVVTFAKPMPAAVVAGDGYEIYAALTGEQWYDVINDGLKRCQYLSKSPITLVPDGDMEASGTASWSGVNATLAKSVSDVVTDGAQSLVVTNTAAGGYAKLAANMPVTPSSSYRLWADYRVVSAGGEHAQIKVYDPINAKDIYAWTSLDQYAGQSTTGGMFQLLFSIPAGTVRAQIYLGGVEATAVVAWDDVIVYDTAQTRYTMPSWITSRQQIATLVNRWGARPLDYTFPDVTWPLGLEEDPTAVVTFRADIPRECMSRPVFVQGERAYGPIPNITDQSTTAADLEWAKWEVAVAAHEKYAHAINMAALARERQDMGYCAARAEENRAIFKAYRTARLGFSKPWRGQRPITMP